MKFELPEFKRCCLCIPLRLGLLTWGYIKLIFAVALLGLVVTAIIKNAHRQHYNHDETLYILSILLTVTIIEVSFTIVLIVGEHVRSYKLLRTYYFYSWVGCVVLLIITVMSVVDFIYRDIVGCFSCRVTPLPYIIFADISVFLLSLFIHFYFTMVVRNATLKLRDTSVLEFVNNTTAEAGLLDGNLLIANENEENQHSKEIYSPCSVVVPSSTL